MTSDDLSLLRHTVATLAYRGGKAVRHAPAEFAAFKAGPTTRTPAEILAHIGDLLDWAFGMADGRQDWHDSTPLPWQQEIDRFFGGLKKLDDRLASGAALGFPPEKVFQGPIADALTHVGQIAMLRRMAGHPMRGESYFQADIVKGRVGPEQSAPRREFD